MGKTIAAYGGGFKPPTQGHFQIVRNALHEFPEIDEFIIYVGSKERDGIDQAEAILVWEIYEKYLANKVDIQPSASPIGDILSLAKENPQDEIYFIIGYREGRDDDMKDVAERTSNLEEKYPNIEVKVMPTFDVDMSGTNARKVLDNEEEFIKFIPNVVKEKSEIWNIVRPVGAEDVYYVDAVNENEEYCPVCVDEMNEAKPAKGKRFAKKVKNPKTGRTRTVSYGQAGKAKKGGDRIRPGTKKGHAYCARSAKIKKCKNPPCANALSRKKWKCQGSRSVAEAINENASYSQNIDYKQMIADLTNYMIEKGRNIEPLPKVKFVDGDTENAKDFFGKTAYYNPDTQTIVLYTEGRHPKDIVRSYSHEMVHHTQNLEDRLGDIQTTNTMEDDNLDQIEQEANLVGTMTFRNWTDSVNEEKDYFGLNKLVKEIIDGPDYKIYSDMDGVLTDFDASFMKASDGIPPREYEKKYGKDKFWELIDGKGVAFWVGMPYMSDGEQYWNYIKDFNTELLSSPSRSNTSRLGKRLWVRNNTPGVKLTLAQAYAKKNYAAPNHILIDDRKSNIDEWRAAGGIGILHTSTSNTIRQLKKLGL